MTECTPRRRGVPGVHLGVLSGPNLAKEIAAKKAGMQQVSKDFDVDYLGSGYSPDAEVSP